MYSDAQDFLFYLSRYIHLNQQVEHLVDRKACHQIVFLIRRLFQEQLRQRVLDSPNV